MKLAFRQLLLVNNRNQEICRVQPHEMGQMVDSVLELAVTDYDLKSDYDCKKIGMVRGMRRTRRR